MPITYIEWFGETFKIDQTELIKSFVRSKNHYPSFRTFNCPEYFLSYYNIILNTESDKEQIFSKHKQIILKEKENLKDCFINSEFKNHDTFFTERKIEEIKVCVQEIEVQNEIINKMSSNIHSIFENCKWYPFENEILFQIFNFAKIPLIKFENNIWVGILPNRISYERQIIFFRLLETLELPENDNLIITKLHTWINSEYSKISLKFELTNLDKQIISTVGQSTNTFFNIKERKIARQKILNDWSIEYLTMHKRQI